MYQRDIRIPLPQGNTPEWTSISKQAELSSILIFPELFAFHKGLHTLEEFLSESLFALDWLTRLSNYFPSCTIVGGTVYTKEKDHLYNCAPIFHKGKLVATYFKRNLYGFEPEFLTPGVSPTEIKINNKNWGIMICADVLEPALFTDYPQHSNIAIPTASPRKSEPIEVQIKRDELIFGNASKTNSLTVFKCCSVGSLFPKLPDGKITELMYQGRSLIASNGKIIARSPGIDWTGFLDYYNDGATNLTEVKLL